MKGQLNFETSVLGKALVDLAKKDSIKTIVEIGTWNGMGSTRCIMEGLKDRSDYLFHSYECCEERYQEAIVNYKDVLGYHFRIILGKLVNEQDVKEWLNGQDLSDREKTWLVVDLENMAAVENVISTVPTEIDLLLLDGGEFSTYAEFNLLKDRSKIIALDDTRTRKCKRIKQELISSNCEVLLDSDERNGVTIFRITK